jgi:hypothetical protein
MFSRRLIPALAVLLTAAPWAAAQENKPFRFSTNPDEVVPAAEMTGFTDVTIRPNTGRELNLFVLNSADDPRDIKVQLLDGTGKLVATTEVKKAAKNAYTRVRFAKAPPPMPAPAAPVAPAAPAAPATAAPKGPPPPAGTEVLMNKASKFAFDLRVIDETAIDKEWEKAKETKKDAAREPIAATWIKQHTYPVVVSVRDPKTYVTQVGQMRYRYVKNQGISQLELVVKAAADFEGPPCVVEMVFPPQPSLDVTALGAGVYRRSLEKAGDQAKLYATGLPLRATDDTENETVYLYIDGVPRAYTFRPNLRVEKRDMTDVVEPVNPAVRLVEAGKVVPPRIGFISLPKDQFPLRVEVDNATSPVRLEITQVNGELVMSHDVPTARHEQVWIDTAADTGAVRVEARAGDWVVPLDTRDMRGRFTLTATLTDPKAKIVVMGEERPARFTRPLILDDTPPPVDAIKIQGLPAKQYRGRPMKIAIDADDPESGISRVGVFIGVPAPDGKLPEPPAMVLAAPPTADGAMWLAQLPIPPDAKGGKVDLTIAATNGVGLTTAKTITIQLLDPPLGGTIKGTVIMGEFGKPQAGATILLMGEDGKVKDSTKTGPKGEYIFEDVLPGSYKVGSAKADSAFGVKGETAVRVKVGVTSVADVTMTRKP